MEKINEIKNWFFDMLHQQLLVKKNSSKIRNTTYDIIDTPEIQRLIGICCEQLHAKEIKLPRRKGYIPQSIQHS